MSLMYELEDEITITTNFKLLCKDGEIIWKQYKKENNNYLILQID